jgi:hypothetical protein
MEVGTMTTTAKLPEATVPEVLTDEHHEALRASWDMPAYERQVRQERRSRRALLTGVLVGTVGLAVGFGAGSWVHDQATTTVAPSVITRMAGPVDANGLNLGRRVAPIEAALPIGVTLAGPVDATGAALGRRVAPFDTMAPTALPVVAPVDANGAALGRRAAFLESGGRP